MSTLTLKTCIWLGHLVFFSVRSLHVHTIKTTQQKRKTLTLFLAAECVLTVPVRAGPSQEDGGGEGGAKLGRDPGGVQGPRPARVCGGQSPLEADKK